MGVIYKATNILNGKSYIGQTINFERRKEQHLKAKDNYIFHLALQKYGVDNFVWTILEECQNDKLNEREIYWIAFYNTYNDGYNMTSGGDNADALENWKREHKEEFIKIATDNLKYANQYWQDHPEERKKQLIKAQKAMTDATKRKVRCIELDLYFDSIADAERWSLSSENPNKRKCSHQSISKVCRGNRKTSGGFHWEYVDVK